MADYLGSVPRLSALFERRGEPDHGPLVERFLGEQGLTLESTIHSTLDELDWTGWQQAGGLGEAELRALRDRFLGEVPLHTAERANRLQ